MRLIFVFMASSTGACIFPYLVFHLGICSVYYGCILCVFTCSIIKQCLDVILYHYFIASFQNKSHSGLKAHYSTSSNRKNEEEYKDLSLVHKLSVYLYR